MTAPPMPTVDERARAMLNDARRDKPYRKREHFVAAHWEYDRALAALTTAISQLDEARAELAAEREKFTMHTAEVGAWLALLTEVFGIKADNVRDACSKVYDAAKEARAVLREAGYALDPYAISAELGQWGDTPDSHYLVKDGPDITLRDLRHAATIRVKITAALGNLTTTSEGEG